MVEGSKENFDLGAMLDKLRDSQDGVRMGALAQILAAGAARDALEEIAECLNDQSERVRRAAVAVLGESGPGAVAALASALDQKQPVAIRTLASSVLARFGAEASPAISGLLLCLRAEDESLRSVGALALGKIGLPAVPQLRELLSDSSVELRIAAANALGHMGPVAAGALADLKQLSGSEAPLAMRLACAAAALSINRDSQNELSSIVEALRDAAEPARLSILERLGQCRSNADGTIPAVIESLRADSPKIRATAALTAGRIGFHREQVVNKLLPLLADIEEVVRLSAAIAISAFGPNAPPLAVDHLMHASKDRDLRVAAAAVASIDKVSGKRM